MFPFLSIITYNIKGLGLYLVSPEPRYQSFDVWFIVISLVLTSSYLLGTFDCVIISAEKNFKIHDIWVKKHSVLLFF